MDLLGLTYITFGVILVIYEYIYIKRINELHLISFFRLMFAMMGGFFPGVVLLRMSRGVSTVNSDFNLNYTVNLSFILIISIIEILVLNLFYAGTKKTKAYYREYQSPSDTCLTISLIIILLIGYASLILWTRAFGSIYGFIQSADAIRAGYSKIYNPFAFLEHFTKVFPTAVFLSLALLIKKDKPWQYKIFSFILFALSLCGTFIVMLCTDSRGSIGTLIIVATLFYLIERNAEGSIAIGKAFRILFIIAVIGFIAIVMSETVMDYVRFGTLSNSNSSFSIINSLETEFGFVIRTRTIALDHLGEKPFNTLFYNDIVGAIFSWIPSRFIPFKLPTDLWNYNTEILKSIHFYYGQSPTDFISASLYMFGIPGVIILPAVMGFALKKIDSSLNRPEHSTYLSVYFARFIYFCIWWVTHFSIRYTALALFGLFLPHLIVSFVKRVRIYEVLY